MSEHLAPDRTAGPPPPSATSGRDRARDALRAAAPALLWYAAARLTGMLILAVATRLTGKDALHLLSSRWDSVWYQRVAADWYGYQVRLPDGSVHADLAFFPLLPALERGLSEILRISVANTGLTVAWTASLVAAWGIYAVGARLRDHRTGVILAVLWGVYPTAFVQSMAYTETLFTAAAAWLLYCAVTDRWIIAGTLATVAGLTRPSAAALIAALGITAVVTLVRDLRAPAPLGQVLRLRWRMIAGTLLAPVGWLGYVIFVGIRRQDPFAYFTVQGDWGNHIDGGAALAGFVWKNLTGSVPLAGLGLCAALALLGWVVWLCVRQRQPLPVLAYTIALVLLSLIGSGYFGSRPRLMMPAFPLLLPAAVALARWRPVRAHWTLALLAVASGAYGTLTLLGSGPP
ncbi:hypothetical protein [Streptomyces sp. A5-4]|uniref:hypothetical protein n=1 Tax=Streptomyces sp. A5-4 TaxID=3384771 RepID=UPI003DA86D6F